MRRQRSTEGSVMAAILLLASLFLAGLASADSYALPLHGGSCRARFGLRGSLS